MAIINRDGENSEKKEWLSYVNGNSIGIATGQTLALMGPVPYPYQIQSLVAYALGMSGAPQLAFSILRPLAAGNTVIAIGVSNLVVPNGFSALPSGYSGLAAQSSTLLVGNAGDILMATTSGANSACTQLVVNVVWKKTQDIVSHNGNST